MMQSVRMSLRSGVARRVVGASAREIHATVPQRKQRAPEEPLPPSLVEKYQLDDPTRYVPLTVAGFGFGAATGLYHFDAETQILALWVLFCGTVYSRGGPLIAAMLDEGAEAIKKEQEASEQAEIDAVKATLAAYKANTTVLADVKALFDSQIEVMDMVSKGAAARLRHGVRESYVRKLDALVLAEEKSNVSVRTELVNGATAAVTDFYRSGEASVRTAAVDAAIAALANPAGAKRPPQVSAAFSDFFNKFAATVKAETGKEVTLPADVVAEIKDTVLAAARRENLDPSLVTVESKAALN